MEDSKSGAGLATKLLLKKRREDEDERTAQRSIRQRGRTEAKGSEVHNVQTLTTILTTREEPETAGRHMPGTAILRSDLHTIGPLSFFTVYKSRPNPAGGPRTVGPVLERGIMEDAFSVASGCRIVDSETRNLGCCQGRRRLLDAHWSVPRYLIPTPSLRRERITSRTTYFSLLIQRVANVLWSQRLQSWCSVIT